VIVFGQWNCNGFCNRHRPRHKSNLVSPATGQPFTSLEILRITYPSAAPSSASLFHHSNGFHDLKLLCFALLRVLDGSLPWLHTPRIFVSIYHSFITESFALYAETRVYSNTLFEYGVVMINLCILNHSRNLRLWNLRN